MPIFSFFLLNHRIDSTVNKTVDALTPAFRMIFYLVFLSFGNC